LGEALLGRGHRVVAAVRDLAGAASVFAGTGIPCLQAPMKIRLSQRRIEPLLSMAHVLHNTGFADVEELAALVQGWTALVELVRPDLVVVDHSPTALVALRGYPARAVALATGFSCPPDMTPMPSFRPLSDAEQRQLAADEGEVLRNLNSVLQTRGQPPLDRLAELFHAIDEEFLITFEELDHCPQRQAAFYWGPWWRSLGEAPCWPSGSGPRVFVYLKPFPALPVLLDLLRQTALPTLAVLEQPKRELVERFRCPTLRLEEHPVAIDQVAAECDLGILNAGHSTTAALLLAGKPCLQIPMTVEQFLMAQAVERLGAGPQAMANDPQQVAAALQAAISSQGYAQRAREFAARHSQFQVSQSIEAVSGRIEALLA
jgi:hypothetical protein